MAALRVAAARWTLRKSCSTTASPPVTGLRERGHLASAARRAFAPLAAGQAAPLSGLMRFRSDSQTLGTCSCLREEQGRCAVRPSHARRARLASCESRFFCAYASLDHAVAQRYEDLAPGWCQLGWPANDVCWGWRSG